MVVALKPPAMFKANAGGIGIGSYGMVVLLYIVPGKLVSLVVLLKVVMSVTFVWSVVSIGATIGTSVV